MFRFSVAFAVIIASFVAPSAVKELTLETFSAFVASQNVALIEFYAPWCRVCQELEPIYESVAESTKSSVARVDCTAHKSLCATYPTPIYPTLRVFHGNENSIYHGPRTEKDMLALLRRHSRPLVSRLSAQDIQQFCSESNITVIAYLKEQDESSQNILAALARKHRNQYDLSCAYVTENAHGEMRGVHPPSLVLYKNFDDGKDVYNGEFDMDALEDFFLTSATPIIREIGTDVAPSFLGPVGMPVAVIFAEGTDQRDQFRAELREFAKETQDEFVWVIVDPTVHPEFSEHLNLNVHSTWPIFAITERSSEVKIARKEQGELGLHRIKAAVDEYRNAKLKGGPKSDKVSSSATEHRHGEL